MDTREIKKCVLEIIDSLCKRTDFEYWWFILEYSEEEEIQKELEKIIKRRFKKIKKDGR